MKLIEKFKIDLIVDSRDAYKEAILSLLERDESAIIVDLGCGDSRRLSSRVKEIIGTNFAIHGIDIDGDEVQQLDGRDVHVWKGDLNERLIIASDSFDVVIASQVIEHLWNTDLFAMEIRRVLKKDGYAIISTPNLASWHNALYLLLGKQPEVATVSDEMYSWKEKPGHRRVFTATELVKLLEFHGFTVEKIVGSSYFPFRGRIGKLLSRIDWRHAGNITVKVRR